MVDELAMDWPRRTTFDVSAYRRWQRRAVRVAETRVASIAVGGASQPARTIYSRHDTIEDEALGPLDIDR